ncbi:ABC transporter permease [Larkinella terrae]|uniref:FtsX-like permease family protein n=1 Tax=Larkinella terrae TaxID=2025311 RepID=A0A7K0ERP0_9BACT|nr:ABC transporter permease [Larkinella terrae]MRS64211.1 FtsX-like permease family protein [Larkinella terrae]
MQGNYFKTTLRHLWRNRLFTTLNVLGLAIGISSCWAIYRIVNYEFSFDTQQPNRNRIYRVVSHFKSDGDERKNAGVPMPMADAIQEQVPGLEKVVPVWDQWKESAVIPGGKVGSNRFEEPEKIIATSPQYFDMVPHRWLAGNVATAFDGPNKVVLTQSRAEKYFPGVPAANVLGRTIMYDDTVAVRVSGVVADLDFPSSFDAREFFPVKYSQNSNPNWGGVSSQTRLYVQLVPNASPEKVLKQINAISAKAGAESMEKYHFQHWHQFIPLAEVHFSTDYSENLRKANPNVLYGLIGIAVFLLLLACINYINLTTAQMPQRAKEVGIRKTLGSSRWHLIRQFLGETLVITVLAVGLSFFLSRWAMATFQELIPEGLDQYTDYGKMAVFLLVLLLGVTGFSGLYPGWLVTRVKAVSMMRGQVTTEVGKGGLTLRKSLIVFQFVVAQLFIVGTMLVGQQLHYLLNKDLGFNREAVLVFNVPWKLQSKPTYQNRQFTLQQELAKQPGVTTVALGNPPLNTSFNSNSFQYKPKKGAIIEKTMFMKYVDTTLLSLYKIPLLAGRNLAASDTVREYIINETALHEFGMRSPQEAVGKYIQQLDGRPIQIVGVVKDFHTGSFYQKIEPLLLMTAKKRLTTFSVKLAAANPDQWQATIKQMEQTWKQFYPTEPFTYKFFDSTLEEIYTRERNMSRIINLATAVAVVISCLGLFGLSTLIAFQRVKEVGVRKVLGATIVSIVGLLTRDFLKLVVIAILIASPIAYYFTDKWLQAFAYKVDIEWWVFAVGAVMAIGIAFVTVSFQSIKAALTNPVKSLRSE